MNNFVKMDVAIELLADKISKTSNLFISTNDIKYQNQLENLIMDRENIYNGDMGTINKVIDEYRSDMKINLDGE
ncbi:MAG: hypothetical protein J6I85_02705 [Clostridia bacterium]|nr:hypothetical protein [Clostridia bacterium]MBP3800931.1 hypothetical protein [Clostridia bacterium]